MTPFQRYDVGVADHANPRSGTALSRAAYMSGQVFCSRSGSLNIATLCRGLNARGAEPCSTPPMLDFPACSGALFDRDPVIDEQLLQLARLEHLAGDGAAADEFALHV